MDIHPRHTKLRDQSFGVQWRTALVHLPRYAPRLSLRITCPEGPYPFIVQLPSRTNGRNIPVWVWLPSAAFDPSAVPVHIDFHGGGFFMGSPLEQAPFCAKLARERNIVVLSVDFCQGPRYQFPAALHDAEDVLNAVLDGDGRTEAGRLLRREIRRRRLPSRHLHQKKSMKRTASGMKLSEFLSLSGFSSGGNIALNLVLSTGSKKTPSDSTDASDSSWPCRFPPTGPPIPLILFYPSFDMRLLPHDRPRPSYVPPSSNFGKILNSVLSPSYLPEEYKDHPRANPGLVTTTELNPRTRIFLVLAEIDTLAIQSKEWLKKMEEEGQAERLEVFLGKGMEHAWCNIPERFISKDAKSQKMEAYRRMTKFWDDLIVEQRKIPQEKEPG